MRKDFLYFYNGLMKVVQKLWDADFVLYVYYSLFQERKIFRKTNQNFLRCDMKLL